MDLERIVQTVTLKVFGSLDIGESLTNTREELAKWMPADELVMFQMTKETNEVFLICHIDQTGIRSIDRQSLITLTEQQISERNIRFAKTNEDFIVLRRSEMKIDVSGSPLNRNLERLGMPSDRDQLILFNFNLNAGIGLVSYESASYNEDHKSLLTELKEPFSGAIVNAMRYQELQHARERLQAENRALQVELQKEVGDRVIGMHQGLKQVMELVGRVAKTPSPVLLMGETGSGKEVIATSIHRLSECNDSPFVSLNCGAIPETLIDSELFGHEKGAFTGANERKMGRFERAQGGTLFLDEVGELPPSAQVKLLRVLQEKEFERIGGSRSIRCEVRLIAATNRDLPAMVQRGEFREDLWFRLNVFPITIPPLRERRGDIPALAYFFIETRSRQLNLPYRPTLPASELNRLVQYDWPGNVRELQNAIERALILSRGAPLQFPYLTRMNRIFSVPETSPGEGSPSSPKTFPVPFEEMCRTYFRSLLEQTNGRISGPDGAAVIAGMNPNTFRSKLKKLGLLRTMGNRRH